MSRVLRSNQYGGTYYVVLVVSGHEALFRDERDRIIFEGTVARVLRSSDAQILAYRWTEQDARFVVRIGDVPLSRLMRKISAPYVRMYNHRHGRTGSLFADRYRAESVCDSADLLEVIRRLHSSVAAKVEQPLPTYNSHGAYLGIAACPWVSKGMLFRILGSGGTNGQNAYCQWMTENASLQQAEQDDLPDAFRIEKGDRKFLRWLRARVGAHMRAQSLGKKASQASVDDLIEAAARMVNVDPQDLISSSRVRRLSLARALVAWHATRNDVASLTEVATRLARDPSSLCVAYQRYRKLLPSMFNQPLKQILNSKRHRGGAFAPSPRSRRTLERRLNHLRSSDQPGHGPHGEESAS